MPQQPRQGDVLLISIGERLPDGAIIQHGVAAWRPVHRDRVVCCSWRPIMPAAPRGSTDFLRTSYGLLMPAYATLRQMQSPATSPPSFGFDVTADLVGQ